METLCRFVVNTMKEIRVEITQLGPERFRAPEILFNPELIGQEYAGAHQVIVDSISRVDLDLRKSLYSNIVLSGGSTLCRGAILNSIWNPLTNAEVEWMLNV